MYCLQEYRQCRPQHSSVPRSVAVLSTLLCGVYTQAPKLDKASFLAELRGMGHTKGSVKGSGLALPGTGPTTAGRPAGPQAQGAPGWGVLSDSFGLQGMTIPP